VPIDFYLKEGVHLRIHVKKLKPGFVLAEDVYSLSPKPIAKKGTVINEEHIEFFRAFLIKEVQVRTSTTTGVKEAKEDISTDQPQKNEADVQKTESSSKTAFEEIFVHSVEQLQKYFLSWQSGASVDIYKIRTLLLPVLKAGFDQPSKIMETYTTCDAKNYICHHSVSVSLLSALIAKKMGFLTGEVNQIALAGLLSDCGMAKITPAILTKKEALTEKEFLEVREHPIHSYKLLKDLPALTEGAKVAVLQHHERFDGSGYPLGIKGVQIHPFAKIISFADAYQAMISPRPYRNGQSPFHVLDQIEKDQFGKFDLSVVQAFKKIFIKDMVGRTVKLSNGAYGKIVFINEKLVTKPMVQAEDSDQIISLEKSKDLSIIKVF